VCRSKWRSTVWQTCLGLIEIEYKPQDTTGIKGTEQLRVLEAGLFDIVSLRIAQISPDQPLTIGFDLVGLNPHFKPADRESHRRGKGSRGTSQAPGRS